MLDRIKKHPDHDAAKSLFDDNRDVAEVKSAYRKLALEQHPDHGGDADKYRETTRLYEYWLKFIARVSVAVVVLIAFAGCGPAPEPTPRAPRTVDQRIESVERRIRLLEQDTNRVEHTPEPQREPWQVATEALRQNDRRNAQRRWLEDIEDVRRREVEDSMFRPLPTGGNQ